MMIRKFLPFVLVGLLSACWQSDVPLIPDNEVDSPKIAGKYTSESTDAAGKVTVTKIALKKAEKGAFLYETGSNTPTPTRRMMRLDHLQGDWYLVQSQTMQVGGGQEKPYYRLAKVGRKEIEEYNPSCDLDDARYRHVSVDSGTCTFLSYQGLKELALQRLEEFRSGDETALKLATTYKR